MSGITINNTAAVCSVNTGTGGTWNNNSLQKGGIIMGNELYSHIADENWDVFGKEILIDSVNCYVKACTKLRMGKNEVGSSAYEKAERARDYEEAFFETALFDILCPCDKETFLDQMEKRIEENTEFERQKEEDEKNGVKKTQRSPYEYRTANKKSH